MTTISKKTLFAPVPPPSALDRKGVDRLLMMLLPSTASRATTLRLRSRRRRGQRRGTRSRWRQS
jgi:hypothetical protein